MKQPYLNVITICTSIAISLSIAHRTYAQKEDKTSSIRQQDLSKLLGWVNDAKSTSLCHGYYQAKRINFPQKTSQHATIIQSKSATYYANKPSVLHNVHVTQPGREITADQATSHINAKNWRSNTIYLQGNVHLHEAGILAVADKGNVNIKNNTATLSTASYRFSSNYIQNSRLTATPKQYHTENANYRISDLTARGNADAIHQVKPGLINLYGATYSTCPPNSNTWYVKASKIKLNKASGEGTAINARLYFHSVPIFYFPYFNFPIDLKRKSGFLYPNFGSNSSGGFHLSIPYYWNIAPNYDLTTTPTIYTDRGIKIDNLFRYVSWHRIGQLFVSILPNDRTFKRFQRNAEITQEYRDQPGYQRLEHASTNRAYLSWQDQDIINKHWRTLFNINYVSDDYYFQDFNNNNSNNNQLFQNQMLQLANVDYDSRYWHVSGLIQNYETLHPVNNTAIIPDQYAQLPRIDVSANYPGKSLFNYQFHGELVSFNKPFITKYYQSNLPPVIGQRYNINPEISMPIYGASYHFIPDLQFEATAYKLNDRLSNRSNNINREVPIFDIDSGLYFQRPFSAFGNDYYQTLEPRLYYLYVPYRDQNNIPTFDTATQTFSYDSIFENNRFTGLDRIGDTNQLGYGITSRFINRSKGLDRFNASIGQIIYFQNRVVTLPDTNNFNTNNSSQISPLVGKLSLQFIRHWYAIANAAYQYTGHYLNNASASIEYIGDNQHVFSIGYNFLNAGDPLPNSNDDFNSRDNLNQIQISEAWKLTQRWGLYSSVNYNISHHYTQTYLYGVEYNSCCWSVRFIGTRHIIGLDTHNNPNYDSGVALQFALKGLGNIGNSSPSDMLTSNIPGYVDKFGKQVIPAEKPYSA